MKRRLIVVALVMMASCATEEPPASRSGLTGPQQAALTRAQGRSDSTIDLRLFGPRDGAVVPFVAPELRIAWQDGHRANAFRLRLTAVDGTGLLQWEGTERSLTLAGEEWRRIRERVGAGGALQLDLVAGSWRPDGTVLRAPAGAVASLRLSADGEHPTGHVLFGSKVRPAGHGPGPVHPDVRTVALVAVGLDDGTVEEVLQRMPGEPPPDDQPPPDSPFAQPSPHAQVSLDFSERERRKGVPAHAVGGERGARTCVSCHTTSGDGTYLAVASQDEVLVPRGYDSSQGVLYVIRRADGAAVMTLPSAVLPRFHPKVVGRLLYSASGASFSVKQRVSIYRADLAVVDVASQVPPRLVPGASDPEHCELFGDWSPDGQTLAFSRSAARRPCEGSRGQLAIYTVPWADGAGGEPRPLEGASRNGLSNVQPRYSPDGRWIVFFATDRGWFSRGTADLWVVAATGGPARKLAVSTRAMESWHAFSPDGGWLAFVSNRDRVDRPWLYVARFRPDGTTLPAVPLFGASGPDAHVHTFDWGP